MASFSLLYMLLVFVFINISIIISSTFVTPIFPRFIYREKFDVAISIYCLIIVRDPIGRFHSVQNILYRGALLIQKLVPSTPYLLQLFSNG